MPINRREILRKTAASGAGLVAIGSTGTGAVAATEACDSAFTCEEGIYVKYELVELDDGTCTFREETDTGIYADSLTITDAKDGDSCEPLAVSWDDSEYEATKVRAKGATDCEEVTDSDGRYNADKSGGDGLDTRSGQTAAISNLQFCVRQREELQCPTGTRSLARYDVDDAELVFEGGEDVVRFSNETVEDGDLTGFDFESVDGPDPDSASETLTTVTVEYDSTVETFEVDPDFDVDKRSGSVSVDGGIERVLFCQAVYVQADFVEGSVIESFCDDDGTNTDNYGSRKISSVTWSSYNGQLDGVQGQFDGSWEFRPDSVAVNYKPDADYVSDNSIEDVALAVYRVSDPVFQDNNNIEYGPTKCRQYLVDAQTESEDDDEQLEAGLPSP